MPVLQSKDDSLRKLKTGSISHPIHWPHQGHCGRLAEQPPGRGGTGGKSSLAPWP